MGDRYTIDVNFLQKPNGKFGKTKAMGEELVEDKKKPKAFKDKKQVKTNARKSR